MFVRLVPAFLRELTSLIFEGSGYDQQVVFDGVKLVQ
jgi:hypothetical protein